MPLLGISPKRETITVPREMSPDGNAQQITVVSVPVPRKYYAVVWGQRTAGWTQRYNSYLLDENKQVIITGGFSAVWDANQGNSEQFTITSTDPPRAGGDPKVLFFGPYDADLRYVAVACFHKKPDDTSFTSNDLKFQDHDFTIDTSASNKDKNAMTITMINAEDGGDSDFHDAVVGVSVTSTKV